MSFAYVTATVKVTSSDGIPIPATWYSLKVRLPSGVTEDHSADVTNPATGEYQYVIAADERGDYRCDWEVRAMGAGGELSSSKTATFKV